MLDSVAQCKTELTEAQNVTQFKSIALCYTDLTGTPNVTQFRIVTMR